jgi:hypothetical protein
MVIPRRAFIKKTAAGSISLIALKYTQGFARNVNEINDSELISLSNKLIKTWGESLLKLQITDPTNENYGGIICPTYKIVHGRVGDTIYPFLFLAAKTGNSQYVEAATLLYRWMEKHVSQPDGSWLNEPLNNSWKGTTVFSMIALCEAIKYHNDLMSPSFKEELLNRLIKAGEFVLSVFNIEYGNINYPITAAYALTLLGTLTGEKKFIERGKAFAHEALAFITKEGFIYGEGDQQASNKGCYAIDLGYNVEESLPSLVLYAKLANDKEVLSVVTKALQTHMEFMLPDGGWDNSWGTRIYKWTYWGSRTSDGCQPAYALMADRDPRFYKVALMNTKLLEWCTHDGLLYGGPHYVSHGVKPSIHHTFCHIKALTTILDHGIPEMKIEEHKMILPREKISGIKTFNDNKTCLISIGKFRATITGYDKEYKQTTNGHATGGAVTMLWHEKTGPILTGSMNDYQLYEAGNMQVDEDPLSMCITPRIELAIDNIRYMNISDLKAEVQVEESEHLVIKSKSKLVDKDQNSPKHGDVNCEVRYEFYDDQVIMQFKCDSKLYKDNIKIIFPVISKNSEKVQQLNDVKIYKQSAIVNIKSDKEISQLPTTNGRVFNFVPGFEALPLCINSAEATITLSVD